MKNIFLFLFVTLLTITLYPQNKKTDHDMDMKIKGSVQLPKNWEMRFDKPSASKNDMELTRDSNYYHFVTGPAAIYYNPQDNEHGQYKIEADFIQVKPSKHPEAYGIFFAGSNLQKDNQYYLYFLVRQDGKYLIKERKGNDTKEIVKWTSDKNVNPQNKDGQTINKLSITVNDKAVIFSANGKAIKDISKSEFKNTVGIVGLRINHNLNVKTNGLKIEHF